MIRYLRNDQIDKNKWDNLVDSSPIGKIYGYSWYLDAQVNWDALVLGNYEYVMPLPFVSKYGIKLLVNPYYVQQFGIYSGKVAPLDLYASFFREIPKKFRYLNFSLSIDGTIPLKNITLKKRRTNYILDLNRPYEELSKGYSKKVRKILRKPIECDLIQTDDYKEIIHKYHYLNEQLIAISKHKMFQSLEHLADIVKSKGRLTAYRLINQSGEDLSSHILFFSHNRAYYIAGYQTEKGKELYGNHFFLDKVFQKYIGKIQFFDFEGSDIPGVAQFFEKWGSIPEYYSNIELKRFPFNILKN